MPAKIKSFAESALVDPVVVNVGRAGATNLDIIQEVEYVKEEAKLVYLLECLQKTAPPVLVFAGGRRGGASLPTRLQCPCHPAFSNVCWAATLAPAKPAHSPARAAENKKDVDTIHEFLLVKGVEAVAVHGSKDQEEREWAIQSFKAGAPPRPPGRIVA
jgi:ATP-dependent RNA helicase DDX41